jgi:uncharacterized protein CbrC (UPF0167 family)
MQQVLLDTITEAFHKQEKVSLLVQEFFPITNAVITQINKEEQIIVVVAPSYNGYKQESQLRKYILDMSVVKGVVTTISSIEDTEDDFIDEDFDDDF